MNIDDIDIKILFILQNKKKVTSTTITKKIFHPKNNRELIKFNSMIYYRIQKWVEHKIIREIEKKGKKHYSLDSENIVLCDRYISVKPVGSKRSMRLYFKKIFTFVYDNVCYTIGFEPL